jgi:hypothetical protein
MILAFIYIILCYIDAYVTFNRIQEYGKWIELNPIVRKHGVWWGIIIPGTFISSFCYNFHLTIFLAIITGMRLKMFHYQMLSKSLGSGLKSDTLPESLRDRLDPKVS